MADDAGGDIFAGGTTTTTSSGVDNTSSALGTATISSDDVLKLGRQLAISGIPLQISNLFDSLGQLRARASGSTAEIFPSIIGQLSDLRGQYGEASQALSRKLGYAGGGQVERGKQKLLGQATNKYARLIQKGEQSGYTNLLNTLSGLQPSLSGGAKAPSVGIRTGPYDTTSLGTGTAGILSTAKQLVDYYKDKNTTGSSPETDLYQTSNYNAYS